MSSRVRSKGVGAMNFEISALEILKSVTKMQLNPKLSKNVLNPKAC